MEITKSQLNYIIAIKQLIGSEVSQKYICEYLGVKKPTASIALRNLEENGYIEKQEKGGINEYCLTEKAWKIVDKLEKEKLEFMSLFNDYLGIDFDICQKEYDRICGDLSVEFLEKLADLRKQGYTKEVIENDSVENAWGLNIGCFDLPFQVVHSGEGMPSMGDKGFIHPAKLIVDNDNQEIILESKQIYYKSKNDQLLKGKLSELYYSDSNMKWILAEEREENKWVIPVEKILCHRDNFGKVSLGIVKIKAKATTKKMPESVAEITFNFKLIK